MNSSKLEKSFEKIEETNLISSVKFKNVKLS